MLGMAPSPLRVVLVAALWVFPVISRRVMRLMVLVVPWVGWVLMWGLSSAATMLVSRCQAAGSTMCSTAVTRTITSSSALLRNPHLNTSSCHGSSSSSFSSSSSHTLSTMRMGMDTTCIAVLPNLPSTIHPTRKVPSSMVRLS